MEIANELGTSRPRITKYAAEWGIPIRRRGHTPDPLLRAGLRGTFAQEIEAAFIGQKAVERMRRIVRIPQYNSLHAAGRALGVRDGVLAAQLRRVEDTVGFTIWEQRWPAGVTKRGHAFIRQAKQVLAELDRHAAHGDS